MTQLYTVHIFAYSLISILLLSYLHLGLSSRLFLFGYFNSKFLCICHLSEASYARIHCLCHYTVFDHPKMLNEPFEFWKFLSLCNFLLLHVGLPSPSLYYDPNVTFFCSKYNNSSVKFPLILISDLILIYSQNINVQSELPIYHH